MSDATSARLFNLDRVVLVLVGMPRNPMGRGLLRFGNHVRNNKTPVLGEKPLAVGYRRRLQNGSWTTRTILRGNVRELSFFSAAAALLEQLNKRFQHGGYRNAAGAIGVAPAVFSQAW